MVKLDPAKTYSLFELVRLKAFPGRKSYSAVKTLVMRDAAEGNELKIQILGTGRATRIYLKGSNIIKFLSK